MITTVDGSGLCSLLRGFWCLSSYSFPEGDARIGIEKLVIPSVRLDSKSDFDNHYLGSHVEGTKM